MASDKAVTIAITAISAVIFSVGLPDSVVVAGMVSCTVAGLATNYLFGDG
jgi:hypothetical protein